MGDYTDSKGLPGQVFPGGTDIDTAKANWPRVTSLITVEEVLRKHLWGLDLVSGMINTITKRRDVITKEDIVEKIDDAVAIAEFETGSTIFPTQYIERIPFDRHLYNSHGYMRLRRRPVFSVERLDVVLANDTVTYSIPLEWLDVGQLTLGQLALIPLTIALAKQGAQIPTSTAASAVVLTLLTNQTWVPSFFECACTLGYPSGRVPKVINELVGTICAMEILSMLLATYAKNASGSLSIDGLSQSISTNIQLFTARLKDLADKRKMLVKKTKTTLGTNFFSGEV